MTAFFLFMFEVV